MVAGCLREARVSYTVTAMDYPPSLGHTPHHHRILARSSDKEDRDTLSGPAQERTVRGTA